ncbi:multiple coagulation factor deficiency protein 2 homolog [Cotesia glomerata]|uniref:Multiple coagulation factor deficiency protein 2-like protein n=1 Tax=Cotesia glomerata TaxID=32391 RepID=A0AAV7I8Z5_COTGL|nr:multiple coagulation factor deficiency protein 2 homolog [Cotesia glomerata]KAH0548805.1 hypothetical protein KQX54_002500 [Cotesia glomerata]
MGLEILIFFAAYLQSSTGFRGPHHPKSSVSHHHYTPQGDIKLTQDSELLHDTAHLVEDMGTDYAGLSLDTMSEDEIEFYFFKMHDKDNNTKLDGLEILHALQHTYHTEDDYNEVDDYNLADQIPMIIKMVDRVLEEDDLDNDGYIEYVEYVLAKEKKNSSEKSTTLESLNLQ